MAQIVQKNFAAGEVSPDIEVRNDFVSNQTGLRTCRNTYIRRQGGLSRRYGSKFVSEVGHQSEKKVRLIPFQFTVGDSFVIEMGEGYFRIYKNGALITYDYESIVSASGNAIETVNPHGLSLGDEVYLTLDFDGKQFVKEKFVVTSVPDSTHLELSDPFLNAVDFSSYGTFNSGEVFLAVEYWNPFSEDELFDIRFSQVGDLMTLVHFNHGVYELVRYDDETWSLSQNYLQGNFRKPISLSIDKEGSNTGSYSYEYLVSTVTEDGYESFPIYQKITGVKQLDGIDMTRNHELTIDYDGPDVKWIRIYQREVPYILSSGYTYTSYKGFGLYDLVEVSPAIIVPLQLVYNVAGTLDIDESQMPLDPTIIYGEVMGKDYDGTNAGSFDLEGLHPRAVSTSKERRWFGGSLNHPGQAWGSKVGYYNDFKQRYETAIVASDPVKANTPSENMGKIMHLLDFKRLFAFTDTSEIVFKGSGESGAISATDLPNPEKISENGISKLRPLVVDKSVLYVQARGSIIRDMMAEITLDSYPGDEISLFSAHLVDNYELVDWAFQKTPHPIVWIARNDGVMLSITYNATQQIKGFARHDFLGGEVESMACVSEAQYDVLYVVVKRTINGFTKRYIETIVTKEPVELVDKTFMDSYLTYDGRNKDEGHNMRLGTFTNWSYGTPLRLQSIEDYFTPDHIGKYVFMYVGKEVLRLRIDSIVDGFEATVYANKDVPTPFQTTGMSTWAIAVQSVSGLIHLEGEAVSILADGNVVSSPLNEDYATVTVTNGEVTLDVPAAVIHVGLPYVSDIEPLDFDTAERLNSMADKPLLTNRFNARVLRTSSFFAGGKEPTGDNYLQGLNEVKVREHEGYDEANELKTGLAEVAIESSYEIGGRVFIRQVDPLPLNILSIFPDTQTN